VLVCLFIRSVSLCLPCIMCFHNSLSESKYLHVPTIETQLHQSGLLPPLISHHPTSCSLAVRVHLSFHPPSFVCPSTPLVSPLVFLPTTFTYVASPPSSLPGSRLHFLLVMGQSSTRLFLLLLLVSSILRLSRHPAKTLLSPPHHPAMNSSFISFLFFSCSAVPIPWF